MIKAIYYRSYNRLTVEGHAFSDEPGHDLVCAAASILAYTLAANVANMADAGQVRNPVIIQKPGSTEISCNPRHNLKATVALLFDGLCAGFALLAKDYPENISYEIHP